MKEIIDMILVSIPVLLLVLFILYTDKVLEWIEKLFSWEEEKK